MLTLWGRLSSINVVKVAWCIAEANIPHERIDAGLSFGHVRTPEYLAKNPNGLVPLIEDDGFVLWESNAIVRYLSEKYAAGLLWPTDRQVRADADRWMDWQQTTLIAALGPAFIHLYRLPAEKRDEAVIAASLAKMTEVTAILESWLETRAYVAGDQFSMGDIPIAATLHRWLNMAIRREERPAITRYYKRIMSRPAAQASLTLPVT